MFVVGCSRSGTTLVYKILSEARELGSLHKETHELWMALHPLQERNWRSHAIPASEATPAIRRHIERHFFVGTGRRRFVDKNNQAGFSIAYLKRLFPDARFVYVKRNPGDTVSSMIEGWRRPEAFGAWSKGLPVDVRIDDGAFTRWCFFLPPGWQEYTEVPVEEVCAYQYRAINEAILRAREDVAPEHWSEVRQEDLVADPGRAIAELYHECGLELDPGTAKRCVAVTGRPHNAFSGLTVLKWRTGPNADRVGRVVDGLCDLAMRMGYDEPAWCAGPGHWGDATEAPKAECAT